MEVTLLASSSPLSKRPKLLDWLRLVLPLGCNVRERTCKVRVPFNYARAVATGCFTLAAMAFSWIYGNYKFLTRERMLVDRCFGILLAF